MGRMKFISFALAVIIVVLSFGDIVIAANERHGKLSPVSTSGLLKVVKAAPVRLQLLCAFELSNRFLIPINAVRQAGSESTADGHYVEMIFSNAEAECVIDNDGKIRTLIRIAYGK